MRLKSFLMFVAIILAIGGCFPLAVSVGPDGRIALPRGEGIFLLDLKEGKSNLLYKTDEGKEASWVQWSHQGKSLLYAVSNEVFITTPDGRASRKLYSSPGNLGYCLWSPDGKWISVAELETRILPPDEETKDATPEAEPGKAPEEDKGKTSTPEDDPKKGSGEDKEKPKDTKDVKKEVTGLEKESLPQLSIIDADTGQVRHRLQNISFIHRWMPDSASILVFHLLAKEKESGSFVGEIALLKLEDATLTSLVKVKSTESWLDVTPSGSRIFFTAQSAGETEKKNDEESDRSSKLFSINPGEKEKKPHQIAPSAELIVVSPDSIHIMYTRSGDDGPEIVVANKDGEGERVVAQKIASSSSDMGGAKIIPVWLNNDEIMYWKYVTVLSPGGKSLCAYRVKRDGTMTASLQQTVEELVRQAGKGKK